MKHTLYKTPKAAWVATILALGSLAPAALAAEETDSVAIIGLDANESAVVKTISRKSYQETMTTAFSSVQDSLLSVLDAQESSATPKNPGWRLQTIGVGIGLSGQIGLGPIWSITASPRIRLIFSNSNQPVYPD